jgi:nickel-dependent lactate racemase
VSSTIRWSAWYGDRDLPLPFPDGWTVHQCAPADAPDIGDAGVAAAFAEPIGTARLRDLAAGKRSPCIVIDDLSRPTSGRRLVPVVLAELAAAGIAATGVTVLAGVANHRGVTRADLLKKVGPAVLDTCRIRIHFSWAGCTRIGVTARGTPVELNDDFLAADLRILVGSIVPHPVTGFSGGAKLVLPAVASIDAATAFHTGVPLPGEGVGSVETTARHDAEEAGRLAGVDFIVNSVPTSRRGIAALVTGDLVLAHRAGVAHAQRVFATEVPAPTDVAVLSSYPKDSEFLQWSTALSPWASGGRPLVAPGGTVVVAAAAPEGYGFHSLWGPGMRLAHLVTRPVPGYDLVLFCPGVRPGEVPDHLRAGFRLFATWAETVEYLRSRHGPHASAAVYPCATTQLVPAV